MNKDDLLVVDDTDLELLTRHIKACRTSTNLEDAVEKVRCKMPALIILDLKFPRTTDANEAFLASEFLERTEAIVKETCSQKPKIIFVTKYEKLPMDELEMIRSWHKKGWVAGIVSKRGGDVCGLNLELLVNSFRETSKLRKQRALKDVDDLVRACPGLRELAESIRKKIANTNYHVLILGERGSGKQVVAEAIHCESSRGPFQTVDCSTVPNHLAESALFGHEPGAFTGASDKRRIGPIEDADGGTVFIDEIGDLSLELQGKLRHFLQEGEICRLGGNEWFPVDARVIAATNRDLEGMMADGRFASDLYDRFKIVLHVPALREHSSDVSDLARAFLTQALTAQKKTTASKFTQRALKALEEYSWPGNIRELDNVVSRLVLDCDGAALDLEDLPAEIQRPLSALPPASPRPQTPDADDLTRLLGQLKWPDEKPWAEIRQRWISLGEADMVADGGMLESLLRQHFPGTLFDDWYRSISKPQRCKKSGVHELA